MVNATVTFNVNGFLVALSSNGPGPTTALSSAAVPVAGLDRPQVGMAHPPVISQLPQLVEPSNSGADGLAAVSPSTPLLSNIAEKHSITLSIKVPAAEELYPTVTLHSPATSVMSRFSAEDIVASSIETIGAPPDATVYAVDGSVIFA